MKRSVAVRSCWAVSQWLWGHTAAKSGGLVPKMALHFVFPVWLLASSNLEGWGRGQRGVWGHCCSYAQRSIGSRSAGCCWLLLLAVGGGWLKPPGHVVCVMELPATWRLMITADGIVSSSWSRCAHRCYCVPMRFCSWLETFAKQRFTRSKMDASSVNNPYFSQFEACGFLLGFWTF